jgi:hypothetical protein
MYTGLRFPGAGMALASASFWCQHFSGVRMALVSGFLWYQHFSGINIFLMSGFPWCEETTREAWAGKATQLATPPLKSKPMLSKNLWKSVRKGRE